MRWGVTFGGLCIDSIVLQLGGGKEVLLAGWRIDLTGHDFTRGFLALILMNIILTVEYFESSF
jgi:hypothetical protein